MLGLALALFFILVRCHGAADAFLWIDDVLSIGPIDPAENLRSALVHGVEAMRVQTGAPGPAVLYQLILLVAGPSITFLLLVPHLAALATAIALFGCARRLGVSSHATWATLVCFALSMPQLVYSQSFQPSMFYALTATLQVYVALEIWLRPDKALRMYYAQGLLALACFYFNFMIVLILALLSTGFVARELAAPGPVRIRIKTACRHGLHLGLAALPLLAVAYLRLRAGDASRSYLDAYYARTLADLAWLAWDFASYHFNYAYDTNLYRPLGPNLLAMPFVLVACAGLTRFARSRAAAFFAAAAVVVIAMASMLQVLPLGGVRHTLLLTPFLWLLFARGLDELRWRFAPLAAAALALCIFAGTGVKFYGARKSALDARQIAAIAATVHVSDIVAYQETFLILRLREVQAGSVFDTAGIRLWWDSDALPERFLLVAYRNSFNVPPEWRSAPWNAQLPPQPFRGYKYRIIQENFGTIRPDAMGIQSIYYPMNGAFIYLMERVHSPEPADPS